MKLIAMFACCSILVACGSAPPVSDGPADGAVDPSGSLADTDAGPQPPTGAPTDGTPESGDAGVAGQGGPGSSAGLTTGVFAAAPVYVATLGPSTLTKRHPFLGDNPAGQPCLSCHVGSKGITSFLFAGTVYADVATKRPAARIEVRVRDAKGVGRSAFTDANGNFFFAQGAAADLAPPATAGVRDGVAQRLMSNALNNGDCNSCHQAGGSIGPLHPL